MMFPQSTFVTPTKPHLCIAKSLPAQLLPSKSTQSLCCMRPPAVDFWQSCKLSFTLLNIVTGKQVIPITCSGTQLRVRYHVMEPSRREAGAHLGSSQRCGLPVHGRVKDVGLVDVGAGPGLWAPARALPRGRRRLLHSRAAACRSCHLLQHTCMHQRTQARSHARTLLKPQYSLRWYAIDAGLQHFLHRCKG
jgi:hypothetical protein